MIFFWIRSLYKREGIFFVYVPDLDIYTEGFSFPEAIEMARDAIGLKGICMEDDGIELPKSSSYEEAIAKAKEDTEDVDFTMGTLTMVDIDFTVYRRKLDNRTVRRNVTLPNWLDYEARKADLNVSKVLQEALMLRLGVAKK